jgi:hypothetical protein
LGNKQKDGCQCGALEGFHIVSFFFVSEKTGSRFGASPGLPCNRSTCDCMFVALASLRFGGVTIG